MEYTGVIFDMDGVLFDTEKVWQGTWRELALEMGIDLPKQFHYDICGTAGEEMHGVIKKYYHLEDGWELINRCVTIVRRKLTEGLDVMKGAEEILAYFKEQNKPMIIASSSPKEQIIRNLEKSGLDQYFEDIISGAEMKRSKPFPDIFLAAAEKIKCKPEDCFVFEDSVNGVKAGIAAGCKTIMVPDIVQPGEELAKQCFFVAQSLIEARERLQLL